MTVTWERAILYLFINMQKIDIEKTAEENEAIKRAYEQGLLEGRNESPLFAVVPISILENKTLTANAKLLYAGILALSKKSGKCYATNEYLANMLGIAGSSIRQLLKELKGQGLVIVSIKRSKKGTYRDIIVSYFSEGGIVRQSGGIALGNAGLQKLLFSTWVCRSPYF